MRSLMLIVLIAAGLAGPAPRGAAAFDTVEQRYADGHLQSRTQYLRGKKVGRFETWWPNGSQRSSVEYLDDVYHGEYRTWSKDGKAYELKHFYLGREAGLQQAWDENGELYLNYEVRNGRRYGMLNAKPCLPAGEDGASLVPRK